MAIRFATSLLVTCLILGGLAADHSLRDRDEAHQEHAKSKITFKRGTHKHRVHSSRRRALAFSQSSVVSDELRSSHTSHRIDGRLETPEGNVDPKRVKDSDLDRHGYDEDWIQEWHGPSRARSTTDTEDPTTTQSSQARHAELLKLSSAFLAKRTENTQFADSLLVSESSQHSVMVNGMPVRRGHFLYLVQGPDEPPNWLVRVGSRSQGDSEAIYGSYKRRVQNIQGVMRTIYSPNTTWTEGRNLLHQEALKAQAKRGWVHEYIVFADDDAEIFFRHSSGQQLGFDLHRSSPYTALHSALRHTQPAVASVAWGERNECGPVAPCAPSVDARFTAFHATAAPLLLPYDTTFDSTSWWASQAIVNELQQAYMPEYVLQFNQFVITPANNHAEYPRSLAPLEMNDNNSSAILEHLKARVSPCLRERLAAQMPQGISGTCAACELGSSCEAAVDCLKVQSPNGPPIVRVDYSRIVTCAP